MTTKFLNIDDIATKVKKVIEVGGKKHEFKPVTVKTFLAEIHRISELSKASKKGDDDVSNMEVGVETLRSSIKAAFPTLTDDDLDNLTLEQMLAIQKFIQAEIEEDSQEGAEGNE